jgi:DNA-binding transcriptional regulator YiaG
VKRRHVGPEELRRRRAKLDMTQAELADQLGVSFETVRKWERGPEAAGPNSNARLNRIPEPVLRLLAIIEKYHEQEAAAQKAAHEAS